MNSRILDQFYTNRPLAKKCLETAISLKGKLLLDFDTWLEPSAGEGSFYDLLPNNKLGLDLEPKSNGIIQADFLNYRLPDNKYFTIGNPPFGKNSSLALKFINKASEKSVAIAFILPRTFKKISLINKVDEFLHLEYEEDLPKNSFNYNGLPYDVPCVFQVWVKKEYPRTKILPTLTHEDFIFTNKENASFAIQRVGNAAGRVKTDFKHVASASHYFISANEDTRKIFDLINWNSVKHNTAGNPSISKSELIELYIIEKNKVS